MVAEVVRVPLRLCHRIYDERYRWSRRNKASSFDAPRAQSWRRAASALDASAASKLRDALLLAAAEVHADAGVVLATSPDASSALQHAWLRACPIVDGADLETHVAVALFWGLHRDERRAASATAGGYDAAERRDDAVGRDGARAKDVAVTSSFGTVRRLTALELAAAVCDAISPDARKSTLVDARPAPGDSGVIHINHAHYEARRGAGQLRCSTCGRFVAGDRALWWHQKTRHRRAPLGSRGRRGG